MNNVRLSMKIPKNEYQTLVELAREQNTTLTRIVRDAIWLSRFLQDEVAKNSRIVIEDESGTNRKELLIR